MVDRAMVRDFAWGERLNRTSIFHRIRNIVPLHRSKPLAICVVQHLEYQRNRIRLIRISYLGWVKFHSFSSSWLNIASARSKRNAYFIYKTISVRDKTAQIHTNTQRKVIVTSYSYALLRMVLLHDYRATVRRFCMLSSHYIGGYTTSFLGVVQYSICSIVTLLCCILCNCNSSGGRQA